MKIRISKVELLSMLSRQLGYEVTEVVLEKPTKPILEALLMAMQDIIEDYTSGPKFESLADFKRIFEMPDQKINCIKALRDAIRAKKLPVPKSVSANGDTYGLAEAKCIIENWASFYRWVERNGRLPEFKYTPSSCPTFQ